MLDAIFTAWCIVISSLSLKEMCYLTQTCKQLLSYRKSVNSYGLITVVKKTNKFKNKFLISINTIQTLVFTDSNIDDDILLELPTLLNLKSLSFINCENLTNKGFKDISHKIFNLENLILQTYPEKSITKHISKLKKIKQLHIINININFIDCVIFKLKFKLLNDFCMTSKLADNCLSCISSIKSLQKLSVDNCQEFIGYSLISVSKLTNLKELYLSQSILEVKMVYIKTLINLKSLKILNLVNSYSLNMKTVIFLLENLDLNILDIRGTIASSVKITNKEISKKYTIIDSYNSYPFLETSEIYKLYNKPKKVIFY